MPSARDMVIWVAATGRRNLILVIGVLFLCTVLTLNRYVTLPTFFHLKGGPHNSHYGAVSSESDVCSRIGADFLRKGGNAVDSAISVVFCLGVVAMYHVGIGGGGFALVRSKEGAYETVDYKGVAPQAAYENMFAVNSTLSRVGGLSVGVPGELRGLEYLHEKYASRSWKELIEPSIKLAHDGFEINGDLARFMSFSGQDFLHQDSSWAIDFAPNGTLKGKGEILTRKRYAETLRQISLKGSNAFYNGAIATATIKAIQQDKGIMTTEDLRRFSAKNRQPIQIQYRNYKVTADDAPAGGPQALSIMKTVEGYEDFGHSGSYNLSIHRFVEAMRFSFGERVVLGDPDFNKSVNGFVAEMISDIAGRRRRDMISDMRTLDPSAYNLHALGNSKNTGTAGVVASDKSGLTIAFTSTVNEFFGSHICVLETGVILNNVMGDFANPNGSDIYNLKPAPANLLSPGKRPMGSQTNLIVEHASNNTFFFATATAGGSQIITCGAEMLWHVLDRGKSAWDASHEPRFHDQVYPNNLMADTTLNPGVLAFLRSRGHNISFQDPGYTINQAIRRSWDERFDAASEPTLSHAGAYVV